MSSDLHPLTLEQFEGCRIPLEAWTHRAHLVIAYQYLRASPFDDAIDRMRAGIKRHNASHGIVDGPDRGYHETLTVAWMHVLHAAIESSGFEADADAFLDRHPQFLNKRYLLEHYSRDVIMSEDARTGYVPPDRAPFGDPRA